MSDRPVTPTLMVQGCTSHAGKSVVVAGLCRLFYRKGFSVVPFKPQNMALNSAVTVDGGEIGRSQAVQAQACNLPPHTDMNPILLKPESDKGAQVIIHGQAVGTMDARQYHAGKPHAMPFALESYHRLAKQHDLIIIEGAGSPAEINLRAHDIANMGFAARIHCPVIVVADIDRGGVFAHFVGTVDCLEAEERALIKGFVINRFRGDVSLLNSGIQWLTERTGIATLGVLPWLHGLHIEAEDAVDTRSTSAPGMATALNVVVPRLPRISNHTDFDVLRLNPSVNLQFVAAGQPIPDGDLIILPGSKNTMHDLQWLRDHGWHEHIRRHLRYGGKLMGVCGGYQMLGRVIYDPDQVEGAAGSQPGLGLMNFETTLAPIKRLKNVNGKLRVGAGDTSGTDVSGYEIHTGVTRGPALANPAVVLSDGRQDGAVSADANIIGSYLHGLFDHPAAGQALLDWAGLSNAAAFDYAAFKDQQIDRVADMLERDMDIDRLMSVLRLQPKPQLAVQAG